MPATLTPAEAIDRMNEIAHRADAEDRAAKIVSTAKTQLVLAKDAKSVFFAALALRLRFAPDWNQETAATDGRRLIYNPDFVASLTPAELLGLLAHEVMHCAARHMTRRNGRDPEQWNVACDLAINHLLTESGFTLPSGGLIPGRGPYEQLATGLAAEEYFAALQPKPGDEQTGDQSGTGAAGDGSPGSSDGDGSADEDGEGDGRGRPSSGTPDPGRCGGVMDAQDPEGTPADAAAQAQIEAEWSVNVAAAQQQAKRRGTLSSGLDQFIGEALAPKVDWRATLREFITRPAKRDYNWKRPNRRHIHAGLYLPSLHSLELGEIVIAVDTSGSIGAETLRRFAGEINDIAAQGASRIMILYHDSAICHEQTWTPDDGPLTLEPRGGGGTDHHCIFERIAEAAEPPAALVCLTDLYSDFPAEAPSYPVLWASTEKRPRHPFGERLDISED